MQTVNHGSGKYENILYQVEHALDCRQWKAKQ